MNIAVFCSGNGSNFQAIAEAERRGEIKKGRVALMVCDNPSAYAIERAKQMNVPVFVIQRNVFTNKQEFEETIIKRLQESNVDLIVLAGYMRPVSSNFVNKYKNKILNIHPALLPSFPGTKGIEDALEYGVKITGVTVHLVDQGLDTGPIILQAAVPVFDNDTLQTLSERIHKTEHMLYPKAINLFCEGALEIQGRKVMVKETVDGIQ
jgi:phosphoribosylglycinamide formyltransferase-1